MDRKDDFTSGSIFKKLTGFMLPILAALILQAMYGAVDLLIVGRFGTPQGISGVTTGSGIVQSVTFVVNAMTVGVTVLMGQYIGNGRKEKTAELIGNATVFFLAAAALVTLIMVFLARPLAVIMQAPAEAMDLTVQYIRICGAGFVFVCLYNFISAIFRGLGNSRLPLLFVGIACVVNIVGDLILVAGLKMNVAGAAIATITAQAVSVLISIAVIRKQDLGFQLKKENFRFGPETKKFVTISAPLALQELLTNITFLALCAFINKLGIDASSGYGIAQKVQQFVMLIPSSLMQSMASFVAQNVGAGDEVRARKSMLTGMGIGCSIGLFVAVFIFLKGDLAAGLFTSEPAYISRCVEFLKGFALEAIVTPILFSYMGYFNGHSKSTFVMAQGLAQSFLVRLPLSYIMSVQPNASLTWIGFAAPCATIFGILLCVIYDRRMLKVTRDIA